MCKRNDSIPGTTGSRCSVLGGSNLTERMKGKGSTLLASLTVPFLSLPAVTSANRESVSR